MAQNRARELGEEALDQVEPGAVFGRERELEAADRASSEPVGGLSRDVGGMVVEDQLDGRMSWVGAIEKLEKFNELAAAMAISDEGVDFTGEQINPGQQRERPIALILVIAREGRVDAGLGRQIRRGVANGLNSRLFVLRDDHNRLLSLRGGPLQAPALSIDPR